MYYKYTWIMASIFFLCRTIFNAFVEGLHFHCNLSVSVQLLNAPIRTRFFESQKKKKLYEWFFILFIHFQSKSFKYIYHVWKINKIMKTCKYEPLYLGANINFLGLLYRFIIKKTIILILNKTSLNLHWWYIKHQWLRDRRVITSCVIKANVKACTNILNQQFDVKVIDFTL